MAGTSGPMRSTQQMYNTLDPTSLILSQFSSDSDNPQTLRLTTESFLMERGPRYKAYADLRESKLRMKSMRLPIPEEEPMLTPPKKQVKFQGSFATPPKRSKGSSILTQSVPDFSSALRKENRKPSSMLPAVMEKSATPPPAGYKSAKFYGAVGNPGGSKSVNSGEKRSGSFMARKSYASLDELKGMASAAGSAINGENRGGRVGRGAARTVLGYRQF